MIGNQVVKNRKPQDLASTKSQGNKDNGTSKSNSTTPSEMKAREELNSSKSRYEKGMELYKQGKVSIGSNGLFTVSGFYEVDIEKMQCGCPDYTTRKQACKHIFACLLFVKNRGKQRIEHLNSFGNSSTGSDSHSESNRTTEPKSKDTLNKPKEAHSKDFDRQGTITRLAVLNTATEILKTHRKSIELSNVISLASQLEQ